jgi:geranylgeranyl transferase type-1 subunit beta
MSLNVDLHVRYFASCLRRLPAGYSSLDTNRLTLVHFCCHALDLLGYWDPNASSGDDDDDDDDNDGNDNEKECLRRNVIDWIYSLQVKGGFIGGNFLGERSSGDLGDEGCVCCTLQRGHIAMNYTALTILRLLGDNWSRLNRGEIVESLMELQLPDGSFACVPGGSESDMRFLYCACCISHMLSDWSGVNVSAAVAYIEACRAYDGAIALLPHQEGHGGSTFCAVASLVLMGKAEQVLGKDNWRSELVHWCVNRQVGGLQGRPNKDEDTCYSYWIGGTLRLLGVDDLLEHEKLRNFVFQCQTRVGGFSKVIGVHPDLLHAYYSLAYLSLSQRHLGSLGLKDVNCTLGVSTETANHFDSLPP